jgi:predicted alpha/beta-fold hydrolase
LAEEIAGRQSNGFHPHPLSAGGHRQTLIGYWRRRPLRWTLPVEDVVVETGEDARILLRATWQEGPREAHPALLLVHGLGGCDSSSYNLATGMLAYRRGWHVVRINLRGAGDGLALCARLYHAGLDQDIFAALHYLASVTPHQAIAGFSLGGNLTLLAMARGKQALPSGLRAAAAVSPPLDLAACADALERLSNRLYRNDYLKGLRRNYRLRQRLRPDLYEAGRERGCRTIRQFDQAITAHYGGYEDAADYYSRASSGPHLTEVSRPVLILAAEDDPLIPAQSVAHWPLPASGLVRREMPTTGGHVGFVAATTAPGRFWAAQRVLEFLESFVRDEPHAVARR